MSPATTWRPPPMPRDDAAPAARHAEGTPDAGYPRPDEITERITRAYQARQARTWRGRVARIKAFFGYGTGTRSRRELVALTWTMGFGFIQVLNIV